MKVSINKPVFDLNQYKEDKKNQIRKACNAAIVAGFTSTAFDGTERLFAFDMVDQANWTQNLVLIASGMITTTVNAKYKGGEFTPISIDKFKQLVQDMMAHKEDKIAKCDYYEHQIDAMTSKEEVDALGVSDIAW